MQVPVDVPTWAPFTYILAVPLSQTAQMWDQALLGMAPDTWPPVNVPLLSSFCHDQCKSFAVGYWKRVNRLLFGGDIGSVPKIQPALPPLYNQKHTETASLLNTWAVAAAGIVKVPPLKHLPILPLVAKAGVPETAQGDIPKSVVFPFNGHQCIKLIKILSFF